MSGEALSEAQPDTIKSMLSAASCLNTYHLIFSKAIVTYSLGVPVTLNELRRKCGVRLPFFSFELYRRAQGFGSWGSGTYSSLFSQKPV